MKKDNSMFLFLKWRVLNQTMFQKLNQTKQSKIGAQLFSTGFIFITLLSSERVWP